MSLRKFIRRTHLLIQEGLYATRKAAHGGQDRRLELTRLEERVLFSASALAPVVAQVAEVGGELFADSAPTNDAASFQINDQQMLDLVADSVLPASSMESQSASVSGSKTEHTLELVFLDSSISNLDQMRADLRAMGDADPSRTLEFVILESSKDGIAQITSALLKYNGVDGLHIVSHGEAGHVKLGSTTLSLETLDTYRTAINAWQHSMSDKADILIYGCNVAASADGLQLLNELSTLTDSDVAGSEDRTGHADLGGDWILEYEVGNVSTEIAFGFQLQSSWYHTLDMTSGLVLHNPFNSNASDSSGNNYNGTLTNGAVINTTSVTNNIGPGKLFLDGTNDYVDFSAHVAGFQGLTQGTISAWVYANSDRDVIFELSDSGDADSRLALFRDADGSFDFYVREGNTTLLDVSTAAGAIVGNTWTHVAVTVDASGNKLYVNGVQQGGLTYAVGSATTNVFLDDVTQLDFAAWGVDKYSGSSFVRYFNGMLDDGRVYNRALTASDITELSDYTGLTPTSTISVTNTLDNINGNTMSLAQLIADDGGDGISLREAIAAADNQSGLDTINFNIAAALVGGTHTINISTALPTIDHAVIINGLSEPDYVSGTPVVRIDGAAAGFSGFSIIDGGDGSTIQGLRITGFTVDGINVASLADNVTIADNWIGTNGTGTSGHGNANVGNTDDGIDIAGSNALILRNVITNNNDEGIDIVGSGVTAHVIQGNYIGLDPDGSTSVIGNNDVGIAIISGSGNTIGGTSIAARNVISNNFEGIEINTSNNIVQGNYIGTDAGGTLNRGNRLSDGVEIQGGSTGNVIGGETAGAGNVIAFNAHNGVDVVDGTNNAIVRNSIHSNTLLGINLGTAGVTSNDSGDGDTGANSLQNFPVLTSVVTTGTQITIAGVLNSAASTSYRIEFYANTTGDGSGFGEGQTLLGIADVTTDPSGNASYTSTFTVAVAPGSAISAIASRLDAGDAPVETSEFAESLVATSSTFQQGTGGYSGTDDTELNSNSPSSNLGANVTIDIDNDVADTQGLILFNNIFGAGTGQIPTGATIVSASLRLYASGGTAGTISAHRMLVSWTEASTWNSLTGGLQTNGTEAEVAADGTYVGTGATGYITITGLEQSVQAWSSGATNHGWALLNSGTDGLQFDSSESATVTRRPQLIVVFTPPNSAPTITSSGGGASAAISIAENTTAVTTVSATDADLPAQTLSYSIVGGADSTKFAINSVSGALTFVAQPDYESPTDAGSNNVYDVTVQVSDGNGGIDTQSIAVTVTNVNEQPVFTALDSTPAFTEGGSAVVLDSNVTITDAELSALNNFSGATLTLVRNGGANLQDVFSGTGTLSALTQGGSLVVGGTTVGTVTTNSAGTLVLTFNANAANALVNSAMQQIAYSNTSEAPPATAQINWTFNDANTGAQGSGGASQTNGSIIVNITAVNDAPFGNNNDGHLDFDGVNDHVAIANSASLTMSSTMTLEAWFKADAFTNSTNMILNKEGEYEVAVHSNGSLQYAIALPNNTWSWTNTGYTVTAGAWSHVAITYNSGAINTYVNGVLVHTSTQSGPIGDTYPAQNDLWIGGRSNSSTAHFDGAIDDVRVWNVVRNQAEIQASLANTLAGNETGLVGYYRFNEQGGTTVTDGSTLANHGALGGSTAAPTRVQYATGENSVLNINAANGVLSNDIDVEGNSLSVTHLNGNLSAIGVATTIASGATVTLNADGSFTYNPGTAFDNLPAGSTTSDSFSYTISDGNGGTETATVQIVITGSNDAPALDNSGFMSLTTINEDNTNNAGNTVAQIIASTGGNHITDVDSGAAEGIAINSISGANGTWQYNTGSGWTDVGPVDSNNALLLRDTDSLRFVPNGQNGDTGTVLFHAWDQTTSTAGSKVNATTTGGLTAFSDQVEVAIIIVTAVNDEQFITTNSGRTVAENSTGNVIANTALLTSDVDNTASQLVYTITTASSNGTLRRSGTALSVSSTFTQADINAGLITYDHNGSETSSDSFSFSVNDGAGSASTGTFNITVTPVNNNPVITSNGGGPTAAINVAENSTTVTTVTATDADLPAETLTYSITGGADSSLFAIDANTGVLTFVSGRNREAHSDANTDGIYEVTVRVSDGTLTDTQAISITITDVDEFNVGAVSDSNVAANSVAENATVGTVVGITASASDADATTNTITYSLQDNDGGRFAIASGTGIVTVAGAIDREADGASRNITVRATSADGSFTDQVFTIAITAINDNTPVITSNGGGAAASLNVTENSTAVTTVTATDADLPAETLTYSITGGADSSLFAIDANTGVLTFVAGRDREAHSDANSDGVYEVTVQVSDGSQTDTQMISVTITDVNEFNVGAVSDSNATANSVAENASVGTAVGITAFASDADATNNTITYTLDDSAGGRFAIDANTGIVTVNAALDYETNTSHSITIRATSAGGSFSTQIFSISVTNVNEGSVGPVSDSNAAANQVLENAANGTAVGIIGLATDPDGSDTVTYSLDDAAGGRFTIDANTGIVTVNGAIDREAAASYNITVRATSSDTSFSTQTFTISIGDVNEFATGPVTDTNATANSVAENSAIGTLVNVTGLATDADATTNTITYSLQDNDGGRFAIASGTGIVTVAGAIDREANGASRNITVRATSADGSFTDQVFTIAITDVDEFNVGAVSDSNVAANSVAENATVGTVVGITASASDADATTNAITYSLQDDDGGRFAIASGTGIVTVAGAIDREVDGASRTITVRATSADGSFTDQVFTIAITDVDEFNVGTVSDSNAAANAVAENASVGTVVGITASASDADATTNTITYSLQDNDGGRFAIASGTGIVTVAGAIDHEADGASRNITVRATSADGSFTDQVFTIAITDVDEFNVGTVSDSNAAANSVAENASVGTVVGITASASDADATTNTITYSLQDNDGGRFAIASGTGIVTVAGAIDREVDGASRNITVRAASADGSFTDQVFTIVITDVDEFNVGAVSDSNAAANAVAENASVGTVVGITASASDADATTNAITYSLQDDDGGRFAIASGTGIVTVAGAIDREVDGASRNITVRATSADGSFTDQVFTIAITAINDNTPVITSNGGGATASLNVTENSTAVTTVTATDADLPAETLTYSITGGADSSLFTIDTNTGVLTFNTARDYETPADAGANNIYDVRVTVSDGAGLTDVQDIAVTITPVNDNNPVITSNGGGSTASVSIAENTTAGTTVTATDADLLSQTLTYSITGGADQTLFTIDANTGVLTFNTARDYETPADAGANNIYDVRVTVSDGAGGTDVQDIAVTITPVNDNNPVITSNGGGSTASVSIAENTTAGTTVTATDADLLSQTLTYSITGGADQTLFTIDANTGVLTFNTARDYETPADAGANNIYDVRVTVSDGAGGTDVQDIAVTITPVNDNNPVITSNGGGATAAVSIAENTTAVTTVTATDVDLPSQTLTYSITGGADQTLFTIDANTGVLTFNTARDYETPADAGANNVYDVQITVSDGAGGTDVQDIAVTITPVNDNNPVITSNGGGATAAVSISENTTAVTTVTATDADLPSQTLTYSITGGADQTLFTIDANTGVLTFNTARDYETPADAGANNIYDVRVTVSDGAGLTDVQDIAVTITPVNDNNPVITSNGGGSTASVSIAENTTAGTTVTATDADLPSQTLTYSITGGADQTLFTIDANTGVLTFNTARDYETPADAGPNNVYDVQITVSDGVGLTDVQDIAVTITPVNDNNPVITSNGGGATAAVSISENTTAVTTVTATDADLPSQTLTYSITGGADQTLFTIDANTGVLTFIAGRDREAHSDANSDGVYEVTVQVSDGLQTDTQMISVTITDVDEFNVGTVSDSNAAANSVAENASVGTVVGITASASDADATTNAITYSLQDDDGGRFAIASGTGIVTVAGAIDREADGASRNITVRATSADGSFTDQVFSLAIVDANEFAVTAPIDANAATNVVDENAAIGTVVGITASSGDSDATTNTVTYSLFDNDGGNFAIDGNTGIVTTAAALNRETLGASRNITVRATSADGSMADAVFTININDVDEFNTGAVTDLNAVANTIAENSANGTLVNITGLASDADATTNTITYSLDDNAGGRFTIDANTGVVTVLDGSLLNYEAAISHNITIRATSADASFSIQSFTINLTDVNEGAVGALSDNNGAANYVLENAANGTTVGITGFATDPDGTDVVTYSLDDNAGGRFTIDANTGAVTVNGAIDREAAASYNITIRATSTDTSSSTQTFTINIGDEDEFNVGSATDSDATANSVVENASNGTVVNIAGLATDADATTNTITYSLQNNDGGRFAIDANTGVVTVAGAINREADGASRNITIRATSADSSFTDQVFSIAIVDANEFSVTAPTDANAATNAVDENVAVGTVVGVQALATDADATTNTVTYSLFDNDGGNFAIDANTGVVTTAALLDRETHGAVRSITVRATSSDGSTQTQSFNITINDQDEFNVSVSTDSDAAVNEVDENVIIGTTVGITANAFDLDATNNTITYSLTSNPDGLFQIDANTGVVTTSAAIDREAHGAAASITVQAASSDGSTDTQSFNITINDLNEFNVTVPTDVNASSNSVAENAAIGTVVGITAFAEDPDSTNNTITYTLDDNAGGLFAIDGVTGVVTVNGTLDYETATSHNIVVRASSSDGSSNTQLFTINVTNVNESGVTAISDTDAAANLVLENVSVGTVVGLTAFADDLDGTDTVSYTLDVSAGGLFAIDGTTGVVTVAGAINRETAASYNITVRATSTDSSSTTQVYTIAIGDVDEFDVGGVSDTNAGLNSVAEDATIGTAVGLTAFAQDSDATTNAITYTLDDSAGGLFAIDGTTGVVTVAGVLDYETSTIHNITVRATSSDGSFSTQLFAINVTDVNENRAPVAYADQISVVQITPSRIDAGTLLANDFDADGDALTVIIVSGPAHGTLLQNSDGSWTYTPTDVYFGLDTFTYYVNDGQFSSGTVTVTIDVLQTIGGSGSAGGSTSSSGSGSTGSGSGGSSAGSTTNTGTAGSSTGNSSTGGSGTGGSSSAANTGGPVNDTNSGVIFSGFNLPIVTSVGDVALDEAIMPDVPLIGTEMISTLTSINPEAAIARAGLYRQPSVAGIRGLVSVWSGHPVTEVPFDAIVSADLFQFEKSKHSDSLRESVITLEVMDKVVVGSTAVVSTSLSVGYVIWILRGGSLLTAFMSAMPAWQAFDPLPILQSFGKENLDDDESLLSLVTRKAIRATNRSPVNLP